MVAPWSHPIVPTWSDTARPTALARRSRPDSLQAGSDRSPVSERQRTTVSVGAFGVLNDYALYNSTHALTHSPQKGTSIGSAVFCRAHGCDQQTDRRTDTQYRPYLSRACLRCGLIVGRRACPREQLSYSDFGLLSSSCVKDLLGHTTPVDL